MSRLNAKQGPSGSSRERLRSWQRLRLHDYRSATRASRGNVSDMRRITSSPLGGGDGGHDDDRDSDGVEVGEDAGEDGSDGESEVPPQPVHTDCGTAPKRAGGVTHRGDEGWVCHRGPGAKEHTAAVLSDQGGAVS